MRKDVEEKEGNYRTRLMAGKILFWITMVVFIITTIFFAVTFASTLSSSGGMAVLLIFFLMFGSIAYGVCLLLSIIATVVINVKRGEQKLFYAPIITLTLSVVTWSIFLLISVLI